MRQTSSRLGCRQLITTVACTFAWLQAVPPSFAGEFSVFVKTYIRDTSAPDTITDAFPVLNPNTDWLLRAINGNLEDDETEKVSSSTVALNGAGVLEPSHFNQNVDVIEVPITLLSSNSLATQLRSKPGGQLTVAIVGQDAGPPTATWTAPAAGQILNTATMTAQLQLADDISGLDPASLEIRLNGTLVTNQFPPIPPPTLGATLTTQLTFSDGTYTLKASARDLAANAASATVQFVIDTTPPVITSLTPPDGTITNNPRPTIGGTYTDALSGIDVASVQLLVDGVDVTGQAQVSATDVSFTPAADLAEGAHTVEVQVADVAGNVASAQVGFTIDTIPPNLQFVTPVDGEVLSTTTPTVQVSFSDSGTGVDLASYQTLLDGVDVTDVAVITETGATYTIAAPLAGGEHEATATIADLAGNVRTVTIRFTVSAFRAIADCAPTSGIAPLRVRFRTRGEFPGGSIVRFRWDFEGDGTFDTSDPVARDYSFTFQQKGTFEPVLEALNNLGEIATDTCSIEVLGAPPIAGADADPSNGPVPLTVTFTGTGSKPDGAVVLHEWDFEGDGIFDFSTADFGSPQPTSITFVINHATCGGANAFNFFLNDVLIGTAAGTVGCVCNSSEPSFAITDPAALANWNEAGGNTLRVQVGSSIAVGYIRAERSFDSSTAEVCLFDKVSGGGCANRNLCSGFQFGGTFSGAAEDASETSSTVQHTYTTEGTFDALFRVTDDEGTTATASVTTTAVRVGPPGSPSVEATASLTSGTAPFAVSFDGSATDDGTIVLWEWDFDGDGTFDFASPTSPATSFTYVNGGVFAAALRATDDAGLSNIDLVEIAVDVIASLSIPDDTFDPTVGETAPINTSISGGVPVRVFLKNQLGAIVRTLIDEPRAAGSYSDLWDGRDQTGQLLPQEVYFAILEYDISGQTRQIDLTNTTGGVRYNPPRNTLPSTFRPFEDNLLAITFTIPASRGASEILAFVGLFRTDTRFVTLLERVPLGVGTHTIHWDGLDASDNIAVPPPGDSFLFGIFGFTLPDNAIFIQSAPILSNVSVDPNFFDPSTPNFLSPENPTAIVTYALSKLADVELTVTSLATGRIVRRIVDVNVPAGTGHMIEWDGRTQAGVFVDNGDYRLTLQAIDSSGSRSLVRGVLVRVFY